MAVYKENEIKKESVLKIAQQMLIAARTAPKAKGKGNIFLLIVDGEEKELLAKKMEEFGENTSEKFFLRDAHNIRSAELVVLLGTAIKSFGLKNCNYCGFDGCIEKNANPNVPCVYNTLDLGIAIGSACSVAMDHRVDSRVLYTAGRAALELDLFDENVKFAFAIPLAAESKNVFFDRK